MIDARKIIEAQYAASNLLVTSDAARAVCAATSVYLDLTKRALPIGQWWELYDFATPVIASVAADPFAQHPDKDGEKIVFVTRGLLQERGMQLGHAGCDTQNIVIAASAILNYLAEVKRATADRSDQSLVQALEQFGKTAAQLAKSTSG
jgi:hypothetical protein